MNKNFLKKSILSIAIIVFSVLILFGNFYYLMFNEWFLKTEFNKNKVYSVVPDADNISKELFDYLKSGKGIINSDVYSEKEKRHLVDVRILIQRFISIFEILIYLFLISLLILFLLDRKQFLLQIERILIFGPTISLFLLIFFILSIKNFESSFIKFHLLFFENMDWILSPDSILIKMFPQQFFYDFSVRFFLQSLILSLIFISIGILLYLITKFKKKQR